MLKFRNHDTGDIRKITEFYKELYLRHSLHEEFEDEYVREFMEFTEKYNPKKDLIHVAEDNRRIVGTIYVMHIDNLSAHIFGFNVLPEYAGVSEKMLENAIKFCEEKCYRKVFVKLYSLLDKEKMMCIENGFKLIRQEKLTRWGLALTLDLYEKVL